MTDGRIHVTPGQVIAADHLNSVNDQSVMRFASTSARDAAITTPLAGMICLTLDTYTRWIYAGSAWQSMAPQVVVGTPVAVAVDNTVKTYASLTIASAPIPRMLSAVAHFNYNAATATGTVFQVWMSLNGANTPFYTRFPAVLETSAQATLAAVLSPNTTYTLNGLIQRTAGAASFTSLIDAAFFNVRATVVV